MNCEGTGGGGGGKRRGVLGIKCKGEGGGGVLGMKCEGKVLERVTSVDNAKIWISNHGSIFCFTSRND